MVYVLGYLSGILNIGTNYLYAIFVVFSLLIVGVGILGNQRHVVIQKKYYMHYIVLLIFMWWYGFFVGMVRGNEVSFIVRNFAGILLYFYYFLLHFSNAKLEKVIRMVIAISVSVCVVVLIARVLYSLIGVPQVYKYYGLYWLTGKIDGNDGIFTRVSIRIASESGIYVLFSMAMYKILYCKRWLYFLPLGIVTIQLIWTRSGGYILALVVLLGLFGLGMLFNIKKNRMHLVLIVCSVFAGIIVIIAKRIDLFEIVMSVFSSQDEGNAIRYNQIREILKEVSIMGQGLGAAFKTINLEKEFPYSIEVIYLNIFHKFGWASIIYFGILIKTYWSCVKNIYNNIAVYEMYICLGLMSYAIIALGNPILFAPQNVIFHATVIYILERVKEKSRQEIVC